MLRNIPVSYTHLAPGAYDIDIEADDINVTDTATVIWEIA